MTPLELVHRPPRDGERVTYFTANGTLIQGYCLATHECHPKGEDDWFETGETVTKATIAEYNDYEGVRSWTHVEPFDPERHDGTLDHPAPETFVVGWHEAGRFLSDDDVVLYECSECGFGPTTLFERASRVRYVTSGTSCHAECHECDTVRTFEPVEDEDVAKSMGDS